MQRCATPNMRPQCIATSDRFRISGKARSGCRASNFSNLTFSPHIADLVRAADHLREARGPRAILIEHSLGGAGGLAAGWQIPDAKAVVTIAAPSDPVHVIHLFRDRLEGVRKHGEV